MVLAVGRHTRLPRRYRGMDVWWWLDRIGALDKTIDEMPDPERARREPSLQLAGRPDLRDVDLPALRAQGVQLAGHLLGTDGTRVRFASDLVETTAAADRRLHRTLANIDRHIAECGLEAEVLDPEPLASLRDPGGLDDIDLRRAGITTIVWATGFDRRYPWLHVPVLDEAGEIRHRRGVTPVPGLSVLGQRFQHRRSSTFLDGVRHDAAYLADHITERQRRDERLAS